MKLPTHVNHAPRLIMSRAILLLLLYAFMAWTEKSFSFYMVFVKCIMLYFVRKVKHMNSV